MSIELFFEYHLPREGFTVSYHFISDIYKIDDGFQVYIKSYKDKKTFLQGGFCVHAISFLFKSKRKDILDLKEFINWLENEHKIKIIKED